MMQNNIDQSRKLLSYVNQDGFPPTVCIQLLKWCNLNCINCRADSSPFEKEALSFKQVSQMLDGLAEFGKWRISITGGEPLYWPEINSLLKLIDNLDFPFSVTTNGYTSITPLNNIPRNYWRNGTLYVSIDGNQPIHDHLRGKGSYNKAVSFLNYARQVVPRLFVNTVLFTDPKIWANDLYVTLNSIGINNWTIISPVQSGRWDEQQNKSENLLSYQEKYEYIQTIAKESNGTTTLSFLDFADLEGKQEDVVFVNSDGEIRLPGFYKKSNLANNFEVKKLFIDENDVAEKIYTSVNSFIETAHYMR